VTARRSCRTRELIEDACQNAWAIMVRTQPEPGSEFGWLYVVATREALRLCRKERRQLHLEALLRPRARDVAATDAFLIDDVLDARAALAGLTSLPERQRTDLALLVAGFSYTEIAQLTGGRTYINVSKSLAKARARVRRTRCSNV
jgi:DNA-directed RNA polymerase specialized sigma24 family protein